jgi:aminomethyltransferase
VIDAQLTGGSLRKRVGLVGVDRVPVREGAALVASDGRTVGRVTSGTVGPTIKLPIAMAWLETALATPGAEVFGEVRGKRVPMRVSAMPFSPHRYVRG